jgi:hypothetical protein
VRARSFVLVSNPLPARTSSPNRRTSRLDPRSHSDKNRLPETHSASPLYVDRVTLTAGDYAGGTFHVVYAGSSNGFVYAVNARMVKKSVLTENKGDLKSPHSGVTLLCYRMWL